jgi:preprotein translocase subunit SecF
MQTFDVPEIDYSRYSNRQLAAVPLAVLALAIAVLAVWALAVPPVGTPVDPGIDFTGGTELQIQTTADRDTIRSSFEEPVISVQGVQATENNYIVTFQSAENEQIQANAEAAFGEEAIESIRTTSAAFGGQTQSEALLALVIAFALMSAVAFLAFRTFIPSIAIVISAFSDIVIPLALMNVFGIKLSLGTVAALLMLIGYSVDSDILLNNHILRRSGDFYESTYRAMRTGVTMTLTSISAVAVMALTASFFGIDLLTSIGLVLTFGLTADLMNTYMLNLSLLRWYKFRGAGR